MSKSQYLTPAVDNFRLECGGPAHKGFLVWLAAIFPTLRRRRKWGAGRVGANQRRLRQEILRAPAAGAKKQKKKWYPTHASRRSKGKVKDKAQHAVILDKTTSDKLYKDVQSYRLVTVAVLVDRLKINGSLARKCLADLEEKGIIKPIVQHSKMKIYTRAVGGSD
ncbi:hypothetical protein CGLO_09068 [Colletotrichum gloeosporioides Cg-14]|uniref:40S ribosomal protein S25 n=1 Tax=Colletotrichum gloeosporioides (strain Cg-14) TaxID=1237896 RepID=T0LIK7_COLGC|nr:hypothetical protein CGLO_09068 [Colletotrichum gloeosporioides Cg-14]